MIDVDTLKSGFRIGEWRVQPRLGTLSRHGRLEHPSQHAMELLVILSAHEGRIVSRRELVERIWDNPAVGQVPLNRCMHELGDVFGDPSYVRSVPNRGFRVGQVVVPEEVGTTSGASFQWVPWAALALVSTLVVAVFLSFA